LHPEWAELFSLASTDVEQFVRFYVFSHHFVHRDAFLCWGEVQLKDVQAAGGYLHEHQYGTLPATNKYFFKHYFNIYSPQNQVGYP